MKKKNEENVTTDFFAIAVSNSFQEMRIFVYVDLRFCFNEKKRKIHSSLTNA